MSESERPTAKVCYAPSPKGARLWWIPVVRFLRVLDPAAWYRVWFLVGLSIVSLTWAVVMLVVSGQDSVAVFGFVVAGAAFAFGVWDGFRTFRPLDDLVEKSSRSGADAVAEVARTNANLEQCPSTGDFIETVPAVDDWLRSTPRPEIRRVRTAKDHQADRVRELRRDATLNRRILWHHAKRSKGTAAFNNEQKICLGTDLLPDLREVEVWRGSYFASFLLNERSRLDYVSVNDAEGRSISDGGEYFTKNLTDSSGNLLPISRLHTSPHIGVNTLGICSDGRLVLWEQSIRAQQSVGLLTPTGSGSLDWADRKSDLLSTVVAGAERELNEESHRPKTQILNRVLRTQVLGYFRWVNRSCLPGFLLVMKLRVPSADLVPNVTEVIRGQMKTAFPAANLDEIRSTVAELLSGGSDLPLSTPLFALIRALDRWIEDPAEAEAVARFLDS